MQILHLTLTKKWFDMVLSRQKKEEYREFKPYWIKKLGYFNGRETESLAKLPTHIHFTNGYGHHRPQMLIEVKDWSKDISHHPEWGGDTEKHQFIFKLGKIIEIKNCEDLWKKK